MLFDLAMTTQKDWPLPIYPYLILCLGTMVLLGAARLINDKDKPDFLDPDIFFLIKISAIGMEVCE